MSTSGFFGCVWQAASLFWPPLILPALVMTLYSFLLPSVYMFTLLPAASRYLRFFKAMHIYLHSPSNSNFTKQVCCQLIGAILDNACDSTMHAAVCFRSIPGVALYSAENMHLIYYWWIPRRADWVKHRDGIENRVSLSNKTASGGV